jgi:hypothetical protein
MLNLSKYEVINRFISYYLLLETALGIKGGQSPSELGSQRGLGGFRPWATGVDLGGKHFGIQGLKTAMRIVQVLSFNGLYI